MCYSAHTTVRFSLPLPYSLLPTPADNLCVHRAPTGFSLLHPNPHPAAGYIAYYLLIFILSSWMHLLSKQRNSLYLRLLLLVDKSCSLFYYCLPAVRQAGVIQELPWLTIAGTSLVTCFLGGGYSHSFSFLCLRLTLSSQRSRTPMQQVLLVEWEEHGVLAGSSRFSLIPENKDHQKSIMDSFSVLVKDGGFPSIGLLRVVWWAISHTLIFRTFLDCAAKTLQSVTALNSLTS